MCVKLHLSPATQVVTRVVHDVLLVVMSDVIGSKNMLIPPVGINARKKETMTRSCV